MYEIRGLSLSFIHGQHILSILLRNQSNGFYIHFNYNLASLTRRAPVLTFIMEKLNCKLNDITISGHVSFNTVGITE